MKLQQQCGFNVCGEGGEFESAVFDCPLFKSQRIELEESEIVPIDKNDLAPVSFLRLKRLKLVEKDKSTIDEHNAILEGLRQNLEIKGDYEISTTKWERKAPESKCSERLVYSGMVYASSLAKDLADDLAKLNALLDYHEQALQAQSP